jgi:hypothetical protein
MPGFNPSELHSGGALLPLLLLLLGAAVCCQPPLTLCRWTTWWS